MKRQLAQSAPSGTSAVALFDPDENKPYTIHTIIVCNVSAADADATIYHDADGTTYNDGTTILPATTLAAGETLLYEVEISDHQAAGNLAVKTSVASALTFTAYGEVQGENLA